MKHLIFSFVLVGFSFCFVPATLFSQQTTSLTQTVRGIVTDKSSGQPVDHASVILNDSLRGAITNAQGEFRFENVTLGRYTITVSSVGYETSVLKEVQVNSAREVFLEIELMIKPDEMDEIIVQSTVNKSRALNRMSLAGARMFSTEEAGRFAGGMDDPARLVSAYAGVAAPSGSSNGISIHGNAPSLLQWRVEDVEVPNPNHFADLNGLGGGVLSSLSSNVLGNSDFFIAAFPAEYNNAVSGVFDMKMRNGNNQKYQHTFQLGVLGIDLASEGPISRKNNSSYIINYRYSTTGLLEKIRKDDLGGKLNYQDLNFKFNFATKRAGIFSLWGTGLVDEVKPTMEENTEKIYLDDGLASGATLTSGAAGMSHRYFFGNKKSSLKTTLAATYSSTNVEENLYEAQTITPRMEMQGKATNYVLTSALNHRFNARHTNKTGFTLTHIAYDMHLDYAHQFGLPLQNIVQADGNTNLIAAYTNSLFQIGDRLDATVGVNAQYFTLNKFSTVEPRASLKWQATPKSSIGLGYGLHSRMEKPDVYFVKDANGNLPNKDVGFVKSHHFMLSYIYAITSDMNLRIEPYYKPLFNVPVGADGYSILNRNDFYLTETLENNGKGKNYGVDITFERFLVNGLYYMVTASLFDSKYMAADGNWYNTRYNRRFITNGLIGKEWTLKRAVLSANFKGTVMGGQRYTPVDEVATLAHPDKKVQYNHTQMYAEQFSPMLLTNFTVSYRMNRKNVAHEFAIKAVNANSQKEYIDHKYNLQTGVIEPYWRANSLFNLSYRIEF